jgi:hypothetical protein
MTIPECIHDYLIENRPVGFCDDCLQLKLGLARRQEVAPVTKTLGLTRGFQREPGYCPCCSQRRRKLVTRAN